MKWYLRTSDYRADGIFSTLWRDDLQFCVTLEHSFPDGNDGWMPKLPRGATYQCVRGTHQLEHGAPFTTFEITGVPDHSGILFHVGNFNRDSNGCVLLGAQIAQADSWWIDQSGLSFKTFMHLTEGVDSFELEVS